MRRYADKNGGLVVEKTDPVNPVKNQTQTNKTGGYISAKDAIETMQSYQTGNFSVVDASAKGVCVFCGKQTAFKNRHVCVDCWTKHKDEIVDGLKTAVKDVEFKID